MEKDPNFTQNQDFTSYSPFVFDNKSKKWIQDFSCPKCKHSNLKIVTYNVWFDNFEKKARYDAVMSLCLDHDIICLQEVTPQFLGWILNQDWIQKEYFVSDITGWSVNPYGVLILSRVPVSKFSIHNMPSNMYRKFLCAHINLNNDIFQIGTCHLESLNNEKYRKAQLSVISKVLLALHSMFLGDFNFDYLHEDQNLIDIVPNFTDVWTVLHSNDKGYTFDQSTNKMLSGVWKARLDRVMTTKKDFVTKIDMIGTTPFAKTQEKPVYPSDHYGLSLKMTLE